MAEFLISFFLICFYFLFKAFSERLLHFSIRETAIPVQTFFPCRRVFFKSSKKNSLKMEVGPTPPIQVPIQRSDFVSREHKLKVNGVEYSHHLKLITTLDRDGREFKKTIESKKIGDDSFEVSRLTVDDKEYDNGLDTHMNPEKLAEFKKNWEKNWKPSNTPEELE